MSRTSRRLFVPLVLFTLAAALPAAAGEGRTPIWEPTTIGPGQEGKYVVTRDVAALPGMPVVDILPGTRAVDIDLNGFTLHGADTPIIQAAGVESVTVRNGQLLSGISDGINVTDTREVVIEDVKVLDAGGFGFSLSAVSTIALRRNMLLAVGQDAIFVDGTPTAIPVEGVIEDNVAKRCGAGIVVLLANSMGLTNNRVDSTVGGDGIRANECRACLISENTVSDAAGMGIAFERLLSSKVYNNVVIKANAEGISLLAQSEDNIVLHNASSRNTLNGMIVDGSRNQIDRNVFNLNGQAGLWLTNAAFDNTFGRNTIRGNGAAPSGCGATPASCAPPDVCIDGPSNSSFMDNMGPGPGC